MTYEIAVTRSEGWWTIESLGNEPIFTQARRLDQVADVAADALTLWYNDEPDVGTVTPDQIRIGRIEAGAELDAALEHTIAIRAAADAVTEMASRVTDSFIVEAATRGLTVRDIGQLLGISHQRAQQILAGERAKADPVERSLVDLDAVRVACEQANALARERHPAATASRLPRAAAG